MLNNNNENQASPYVYTDLACERNRANTTLPGVSYHEETIGNFQKSILRVTSEEGKRAIGKPCGTYMTLSFKPLWTQSEEEMHEAALLLSTILKEICPKTKDSTVLIAGLGNRMLTVDAVGPSSIEGIVATAHLADLEPALFKSLNCQKITTFTPGVLSETGMESAELIAGAAGHCHADFIIVIDALVARSCSRLASTIQVSDTGILPGAGVGNPRTAIDKEKMGVPVIVIGVPTVVNSSTLLYDALSEGGITEIPASLKKVLENGRGYFVSPRECDAVTKNVSHIIADAINEAFGVHL